MPTKIEHVLVIALIALVSVAIAKQIPLIQNYV